MKYTEQDKKAIELVKDFLEQSIINKSDDDFFKSGGWETIDMEYSKAVKVIFELVEKQQKEIERLENKDKEYIKILNNNLEWKEKYNEVLEDKCKIADERNHLLLENEKLKDVIDILSFEVSSLDEQLVLNRFRNKEEVKQFFMEKLDLKYILEIVSPIYVKENYISKDKIREKIEEYAGLKEIDIEAYNEQIRPLEELLGDE